MLTEQNDAEQSELDDEFGEPDHDRAAKLRGAATVVPTSSGHVRCVRQPDASLSRGRCRTQLRRRFNSSRRPDRC
jgi:hypothetical protein